jgi:hypothetical protein
MRQAEPEPVRTEPLATPIPFREEAYTSAPGEVVPREIRCDNCGLLLAKGLGFGGAEIRWKELWLRVWGRAKIRCRKCGTICDI